jgi:undecaprenyl-diphosphatase
MLNNIVISAILGIVQGISEWLPISSKTQVGVASIWLLHLTFSQAYTLGLFFEIGTVLAAVIYFRREVASLVRVLVLRGSPAERKLFVYVLVTTVVTAAMAVPLYLIADSIKGVALGIPMLIVGMVLIADSLVIRHARKRQHHAINTRKFNDLKIKDYIIIGIAQGIAALPGVSRSGVTTSVMLLMKVEPDEAFRLSFIIGIFAALGAFGLTLLVSHGTVSFAVSELGLTGLMVSIVAATIVSLLLIDFLIKVAGKSSIVYLTAALGLLAIFGGMVALLTGVGG